MSVTKFCHFNFTDKSSHHVTCRVGLSRLNNATVLPAGTRKEKLLLTHRKNSSLTENPRFSVLEDDYRAVALTIHGVPSNDEGRESLLRSLRELDGIEAAKVLSSTEGGLRGSNVVVQLEVAKKITLAKLVSYVHSLEERLLALPYKNHQWIWRGCKVNYAIAGKGQPIILVHGFGGNAGHFRNLISLLAEKHKVYAVDLLGFGDSDKPSAFTYGPNSWAELILDFNEEFVESSAVLVGNSIGSLTALTAAAKADSKHFRGLVLLNVAGGMNRKGLAGDDLFLSFMTPIFVFLEWLLLKPAVASFLFNKFRSKENMKKVLEQAYRNKKMVTDQLVDILYEPSQHSGAVDVFVKVFTGHPGERPEALMAEIDKPTLVLWGDKDPWTPINGKVANFFKELEKQGKNVKVFPLEDVGHCPHDDRPEAAAEKILQWMDRLDGAELEIESDEETTI